MYPHRIRLRGPWECQPLARAGDVPEPSRPPFRVTMPCRWREAGLGDVPIVVGGIVPADDVNVLKQCGASAVYTPKDFQLNDIMLGIVKLVDAKAAEIAEAAIPVPPLRARERMPS